MSPRVAHFVLAMTPFCATGLALSGDDVEVWTDGFGDAKIRRTDTGCDGQLNPQSNLPDVLRVSLSGWRADDALFDPYLGEVDDSNPDLFRLDVTFAGLVNPAGRLGIGADPFEPFRYGPSPVLGFLEIDVDDDEDTGGQLEGAAELRFLANVARFGGLPGDENGSDLAERAALSGSGSGECGDHDLNFFTKPFFERSGEDFALVLCGCHDVTIVSRSGGDNDELFEAGETWVVQSRYWQRAAGYQEATCTFGGTAFGLYDPIVRLRFQHEIATDTTTITLVEALTMRGAAELTGDIERDANCDLLDQHSVFEALWQLVESNNVGGPVEILIEEWRDQDAEDYLDPEKWEIHGIFGTSYLNEEDSLYVWTDVGFDVRPCDLDGNVLLNELDLQFFDDTLVSLDGSNCDDDGQTNEVFTVDTHGPNFNVLDFNGDGRVDASDRLLFCRADITGSSDPRDPSYGVPDGDVDADDLFYFLDQFNIGNLTKADLTGSSDPSSSEYGIPNLQIDSDDFFFYLDQFEAKLGCP